MVKAEVDETRFEGPKETESKIELDSPSVLDHIIGVRVHIQRATCASLDQERQWDRLGVLHCFVFTHDSLGV
jgi:hypothetical protein